jgi:hypothetical protein
MLYSSPDWHFISGSTTYLSLVELQQLPLSSAFTFEAQAMMEAVKQFEHVPTVVFAAFLPVWATYAAQFSVEKPA